MLRFVACLAVTGMVLASSADVFARCCRRGRRCHSHYSYSAPTSTSSSASSSGETTIAASSHAASSDPVTAEEESWWQEMVKDGYKAEDRDLLWTHKTHQGRRKDYTDHKAMIKQVHEKEMAKAAAAEKSKVEDSGK